VGLEIEDGGCHCAHVNQPAAHRESGGRQLNDDINSSPGLHAWLLRRHRHDQKRMVMAVALGTCHDSPNTTTLRLKIHSFRRSNPPSPKVLNLATTTSLAGTQY
jgi:hypothetical protein